MLAHVGAASANENFYNEKMARCLGGKTEQRLYYPKGYVRVDIETKTHLIEAGMDSRSSLDSVQQALFFHLLNKNKAPMVILYDTDGRVGKIEWQIRAVCERLGIAFQNVSAEKLRQGSCP